MTPLAPTHRDSSDSMVPCVSSAALWYVRTPHIHNCLFLWLAGLDPPQPPPLWRSNFLSACLSSAPSCAWPYPIWSLLFFCLTDLGPLCLFPKAGAIHLLIRPPLIPHLFELGLPPSRVERPISPPTSTISLCPRGFNIPLHTRAFKIPKHIWNIPKILQRATTVMKLEKLRLK